MIDPLRNKLKEKDKVQVVKPMASVKRTRSENAAILDQHLEAEPVVDNLSTGVIFVDKAGVVTVINKKAESILQVARKFVQGKRVDMLPLKTAIYKVMTENCRDFPMEMNVLGRGIVVRSTEVLAPDGSLLGELVELSDVTAEKREKRQREDFVAMMTHDLKSPLMVMLGYLQAIKLGIWGDIDQQVVASIDEIERSGHNMSSLIENVLDVYRLGKGVVQIDRKLTDMNELLRNCYQDSKVKAHEQQIQLKISMVQLPALFVDDRQLSRVFANLVENALKFTPRLGKVKICAALEDEMLVVSVSDSGIGIKESDLSQIFQKYFRAKNAAGYKGTGLGLTISKAIVEAHGGVIEVFSRVGEGSTFTVKLPVGMELQNETGHSVPLPVSGREYKKV